LYNYRNSEVVSGTNSSTFPAPTDKLTQAKSSSIKPTGSIKMGLGILEDTHLDHVPGTALLTDMVDAEHHQFHGVLFEETCLNFLC
jgi:hypothetical protein